MSRRWLQVAAIMIVTASMLVAVAIGVWALNKNRETATSAKQLALAIKTEGVGRRDQTCSLFERDHLRDVQSLRTTYDYLDGLSAAEKRLTLNKLILTQLPKLEAEANTDRAPSYCDEPNIGLPEPDPVVPERPPGLIP